MSITRGTFFRFHTTTHTYMITNFQSFKIKLYLRLTYIFNHLHNFPWFPFCLQYIFSLHHNNWIVLFSMVYLYESAKYLILNKNCTSFREKLWTFSDKQFVFRWWACIVFVTLQNFPLIIISTFKKLFWPLKMSWKIYSYIDDLKSIEIYSFRF